MSKNKSQKTDLKKANHIVNSENDFAAEFGEELYGGQARVAFEQQQARKNNNSSK